MLQVCELARRSVGETRDETLRSVGLKGNEEECSRRSLSGWSDGVSAYCIVKQAAVKTTLTDVDVMSGGRSRGRTQTDALLIYAASVLLDVSAACNAVN